MNKLSISEISKIIIETLKKEAKTITDLTSIINCNKNDFQIALQTLILEEKINAENELLSLIIRN